MKYGKIDSYVEKLSKRAIRNHMQLPWLYGPNACLYKLLA